MEIKTILDYLRVINQLDNSDALARIINTPSRRIGDTTIKSLLEEADRKKITLWSLVLGAIQGREIAATKIQKQAEQALSKFVNIILTAQGKLKSAGKGASSTVELINFVIEKIDYEKWLEVYHNDVTKARWDNVKELITQAADFQDLVSNGYEDEALPEIDGLEQQNDDNHLSKFLSNVALASEVKNDDAEGAPTAQVTISTIHAAKGLEWPVVFIPAVYEGSIPHSRADDNNEERRLLYVAMTRAKALLYMSVPLKNSQSEGTTLCPFLTSSSLTKLLEKRGPVLAPSVVQSISQILQRTCPDSKAIAKSSSFLKSINDDVFPEDGEENIDNNSRWSLETTELSALRYSTDQQTYKRRKVDLGRPTSGMASMSEQQWKPTYTTTMARASTFTAASVNIKSGFVSAGSHLQILKEQSVNAEVEEKENIRIAKQKLAAKSKVKNLESQGNLMTFLGKPQLKADDTTKTAKNLAGRRNITTNSQMSVSASHFSRPRISTSTSGGHSIAPDLAAHRIGPSKFETRPRAKTVHVESHGRNEYVFLSSSPPRPEKPTIPDEHSLPPNKGPALTVDPPLMPLIRPASTMHTTSMAKLQSSMAAKKTLGVKRSLDGWSNRASKGGNAFVPPTRKF
jgi:DNA helicase-2/ATP-dependent DNA helicase PcrA